MRYDRAIGRGARQQRQLEILWRSVNSDVEEVANRQEGDQRVNGGRGDDAETSCTYCGRDMVDSAGESGDSHAPVLIQCGHGESAHARCMLDRADHIARGHTDPRPRVACQSACPEGSRPPHPAALTRGLSTTEKGGIWTAVRSTVQFVALLQRGDLGTEPAKYVTTGVHTTFALVVSTFGRSPTSSFVVCSLFSDALDLPQEFCLDFPCTREWEATAAHYRTLFTAPYAVHRVRYSIAGHLTQTPKSETIRWTSRSSVFGGR